MIPAIRPTESKDLPSLAKFLIRIYNFDAADHHASTQLLEWKYLRPRPGWPGSRSYLLEKDGQILAHCGICPVTFHLPDKTTVNSITMMDWAADPTSPGVGVKLFRKLMEMAPTSFIIGGAPATRHIVPRIGFKLVADAFTYSVWLRPWREFQTRPRTPKSILRLFHGLAHPLKNRRALVDWDFAPVSQFDDSILPVLTSERLTMTFCNRTVAELNYLLECPHLKMQGFLLRRRGDLIGYFIIGRAQWETRLLDIVVNSSDANDWNLAYAAVVHAALQDPQACRLRVLSSIPLITQALSCNGFWLQYKEPIAIYDPTRVLDRDLPIGFQLFDGDAGF
jgi:hypothetical protein